MKRKTLSILLAVCMVFTLLPMQALATTGDGLANSTSTVTDSGAQGGLSNPSGLDNALTGEGISKLDCTCPPVDSGEQVHGADCPLYKAPAAPEQADAVKNVLALIEALPTMDDLEAQNPDGAGFPAYLAQLRLDVAAARAAYDALTPEQKATFDAAALAKLMALETALAVPMLMSATAPNITIKVNNNATEYIGVSLEETVAGAIAGEPTITTLTITAGTVTAEDWKWFAGGDSHTPVLSALENFTIVDDTAVIEVANIPDNSDDHNRNFPESIKAVSIAKVTTIGQKAFYICKALTTASFPAAKSIGASVFFNCTSLTTASFPAAKSIGNYAFDGCTSLTTASFPAAKSIGNYAFDGCTSLTTASFPAATDIGNLAFHASSALATLKLGAVPPDVGEDAFRGCPATRALVLVDANGNALTGGAFNRARAAYDAVVDGMLDSTATDGLWYGWKLPAAAPAITIIINGTTTVYGATLQAAVEASGVALGAITTLTITAGKVTAEDWEWFAGGNNNNNTPVLTKLTHFTVVDDAAVTEVADIPGVSDGRQNSVFPKSIKAVSIAKVTTIGKQAFYHCVALTTVSFPAAKSIGDNAFINCTALTTVTFPAATTINAWAFYGCTALATASFPAAKSIDDWAFYDCEALTTLKLPAKPPNVKDAKAFSNCPATRALVLVDTNGNALTGNALNTARANYKVFAAADGLWYGWKLPAEAPVTSITVTTLPTKTTYTVGDTFETAGMVVTATYSDNSTAAVTGYTTTPSGALIISDNKITVSYTEGGATKTTDVSITVTDAPITPPSHTHAWAAAWTTSPTHHWHECTAAGCPITADSGKDSYGTHVYDNDTDTSCNTCNYTRTITPPSHTHVWAAAWETSTTHHWHECTAGSCPITENTGKGGYGIHVYESDTDTSCNTCNYTRTITPPSTGGGDSSSGGSSSSGSTTPPARVINSTVGSATLKLLADAVKVAVAAGKTIATAYVNYANYATLTKDGLKAITDASAAATKGTTIQLNTQIQLDNKLGNVVLSRVTIDSAKLSAVMPNKLDLNVWFNQATDAGVVAVNKKFNKYFTNKLYTITFAEKTPLAVSIELALKPDFSGLNTKNLHFYSYNPTTNIYTRIAAPAYWVDKNGYSHITVPFGGSIIITDTPLTKK